MKKKDRQIVWDEHEYHGQKYYYGFYKRKKMFLIDVKCGVYLRAMNTCMDMFINGYTTRRDAKRGAERFLRRLQEVVKLEKKEPKTCDDCWLQRDFGNYIPAGYCADKCAKIYNALKD